MNPRIAVNELNDATMRRCPRAMKDEAWTTRGIMRCERELEGVKSSEESRTDRERIVDLLMRLQRGDRVDLRAGSDDHPVTYTVERMAKESHEPSDRLFHRVHLRGRRGGSYAAYPTNRPDWIDAGSLPELRHVSPNHDNGYGHPQTKSEGTIHYLKLEIGNADGGR